MKRLILAILSLLLCSSLVFASQVKNETDTYGAFGGLAARRVSKTLTFAGGTPDAIGDHDGTGDPTTLFTVTGDVVVKILAVCTTNLAFDADAAIEIGINGGSEIITTSDQTVSALIAQEIWHDATPDAEIEAFTVLKEYIITDGANNPIQLDTTTANVNTGVIEFYAFWVPLSTDGNVQ